MANASRDGRRVKLLASSGVARGPETYGEDVADDVRDALRVLLRAYEEKHDRNDPDHVRQLQEMREHTRALEQRRGIWARRGAPGVERDWMEDTASKATTTAAPRENKHYADYLKYCEKRDAAARGDGRMLAARAEDVPEEDDLGAILSTRARNRDPDETFS